MWTARLAGYTTNTLTAFSLKGLTANFPSISKMLKAIANLIIQFYVVIYITSIHKTAHVHIAPINNFEIVSKVLNKFMLK